MTAAAVTAALYILVVVLSVAVATLYVRTRQLRSRYKLIIDAEAEGRRLQLSSPVRRGCAAGTNATRDRHGSNSPACW
jgi:hypothetical protein